MTTFTDKYNNVPFSYSQLAYELSRYRAPKNKAQELEKKGAIIRLKKGLYINTMPPYEYCEGLMANYILRPSYVSSLTALREYGLIPEHVHAIQSSTFIHTCEFINSIGRFDYVKVPIEYYPIGLAMREEKGACYLIASPEKALADLILNTPNLRLRSTKAAITYLEDDLRLDMERFQDFIPEIFEECSKFCKKGQSLNTIASLLK
ncbi:MAG: hypothetical protein LIP09_15595 [Bacteroidales bacterium]|nr:hypothetical protein [Bacteroidales bacterium]